MNINATLIAQAVVMIVFVAICWRYIYPPIVAAMQERQKKISDGLEAAKKADDSLEEAKLAYEKEERHNFWKNKIKTYRLFVCWRNYAAFIE